MANGSIDLREENQTVIHVKGCDTCPFSSPDGEMSDLCRLAGDAHLRSYDDNSKLGPTWRPDWCPLSRRGRERGVRVVLSPVGG